MCGHGHHREGIGVWGRELGDSPRLQFAGGQGVFEFTDNGMVLTEIGEGFSVEDVRASTGAKFTVALDLKPMRK
jgi:hypothetical protein